MLNSFDKRERGARQLVDGHFSGVAAGVGLAISGENQLGLSYGDKMAALDFVAVFLLLVGFHTFEAAQRHNLSSIAGQIEMARIRQSLAELDPKLETLCNGRVPQKAGTGVRFGCRRSHSLSIPSLRRRL